MYRKILQNSHLITCLLALFSIINRKQSISLQSWTSLVPEHPLYKPSLEHIRLTGFQTSGSTFSLKQHQDKLINTSKERILNENRFTSQVDGKKNQQNCPVHHFCQYIVTARTMTLFAQDPGLNRLEKIIFLDLNIKVNMLCKALTIIFKLINRTSVDTALKKNPENRKQQYNMPLLLSQFIN